MILLWGLSGDDPLEEVREALERLGAPFILLDQRDALSTELELSINGALKGVVRTPRETFRLEDVSAVYLRAYDSRQLQEVALAGEGSAEWTHALSLEGALYSFVELTDALVVNRPTAMATNNSKPFQAALIRRHGFEVPPTLITNDPVAARDFQERHGPVIYKSISSVRSIVSRLTPEQTGRLEDVVWCPTQFQRQIEGTDYRVHVVGTEVFPCEIISEADDYRYARREGLSLELNTCALPHEVAERSRSLAAALGLSFAGIDLRRTPEGCWYCFEVNPSPGFTFYEPDEDPFIADAVARLLLHATR
jgi:hypothetical protein